MLSLLWGLGIIALFAWLLFRIRYQVFEKLILLFNPFFWVAVYLLMQLLKKTLTHKAAIEQQNQARE